MSTPQQPENQQVANSAENQTEVGLKEGLIGWFARNHVAANLLMMILMLAGLFSVITIKKQVFPEIKLEQVTIRVPYLGAAPQEVESGVIDKIEESLRQVNGIKKLTSVANEGLATVIAEVETGYDIQEVMDEIKTQVGSISSLPEQTEKPVVYRTRFSSNVMWVSIYGSASEATLKEMAKDVRDELKLRPGINKVEVVGARPYEISLEVSEEKMREYGLTFEQVVNAVRASSVDLPGGAIKAENGNMLLRAKGQAYVFADFSKIVLLRQANGAKVMLSDIATIRDDFTEIEGFTSFDGKPSISLRVDAIGDDNTLKIAQSVKDYIRDKKANLPDSVNISYWGDSSYYLQGRLDLMTDNMLVGALLVLISLTIFLEFRVAFWVMMGIPICFLGALALLPMPWFDVSINMISLFGFILVLGIVVDDAIIIGESAYTEIEKNGKSERSVIQGALKVATPATFGVLTTVAAFVPMLLVGGPQSGIWGSIAWVVVLCLLLSIIESKFILPAHLVRMDTKPWDPRPRGLYALGRFGSHTLRKIREATAVKMKWFIEEKYRPTLALCLTYRYVTVASFFAALVLTIGLLVGGYVRWVFFPNLPSDFIRANLQMEEGASGQATVAAMQQIEQALQRVNRELGREYNQDIVKHRLMFLNNDTGGQLVVELEKSEGREIDGFEIANRWREQIPEIPGVKSFKISAATMGGGEGGDLSLELKGTDLATLQAATDVLKKALANYEGVFDIDDSLLGGNDEIVLALKPEADLLGITLTDLARQVRYGFYGAEVQRLQRDGEEVKVMVRYPRDARSSIGDLDAIKIRTSNGGEVPFSQIATYSLQPSYSTITRVNGVRAVTVTAAVDKSKVEPSQVIKELKAGVLKTIEDDFPGVKSSLGGASLEEADAIGELLMAGVLALFGIYALMAIPLKSYSQPLLIMSVIPFGMVGAFVGHLVLGLDMSIMSIFGLIALAGVVVNDSIIMVDFVNEARARGVKLYDAVMDAGSQRFRAIMLTSLTTFLGLAPIVLERSLQAQIVIPMAVSLAFGILFATVITLLLIPVLYLILEDFKNKMRGATHS